MWIALEQGPFTPGIIEDSEIKRKSLVLFDKRPISPLKSEVWSVGQTGESVFRID